MRYFVGVMQPKSMGEYECGWSRTRYTVDDGEDADEVMKMMVSGCEEFDHNEIGKKILTFHGDTQEQINANEVRDQYHYCDFQSYNSYHLTTHRPSPDERLEAIEEYKRLQSR